MGRVAVLTDSAACLPKDLVERYQIKVAPLFMAWEGREYTDGVNITPDEVYSYLRRTGKIPTGSGQASSSGALQGEFIRAFEAFRGKAEGVVAIVLSQDLSATYSAALNASKLVDGLPIELIDSRLAMPGEGFVALAAARAAAEGKSLEEVKKVALETMPKQRTFVTFGSLKYLRYSGRIGFGASVLARLLKINPILTIKDGKLELEERTRSREQATQRLLALVKEQATSTPLHAAVMYGDVVEEANQLRDRIAEAFNPVELWVRQLTPVLGMHTGPDTLGVAFYNE